MTKLKVAAGPFAFEARLETELAPKTCKAFLERLPFESKIVHVRWSGEGVWIPLGDYQFNVGYENATSYPAPGPSDPLSRRDQRDRNSRRLRRRAFRFQGRSARRQPFSHPRLGPREPLPARPQDLMGGRAADPLRARLKLGEARCQVCPATPWKKSGSETPGSWSRRSASAPSGLGDMPDTYGYGVDAARAAATMRRDLRRAGQLPRYLAHLRHGPQRGAHRRRHSRARRLPAGFVVSTKLDRDPATNVFDAARARRSLEQSLKALGLERIDLLHLHDPEHSRSLGEATGRDGALGELFRIKEEGLAKAVGLAAGNVDDDDAAATRLGFRRADHPQPLHARQPQRRSDDRPCAPAEASPSSTPRPMPAACSPRARATIRRYVYQEASDAALDADAPRSRRSARATARRRARRRCSSRCATSASPRRCAASASPSASRETLEWARFPIPEAVWEELARAAVFDRRSRSDARVPGGVDCGRGRRPRLPTSLIPSLSRETSATGGRSFYEGDAPPGNSQIVYVAVRAVPASRISSAIEHARPPAFPSMEVAMRPLDLIAQGYP